MSRKKKRREKKTAQVRHNGRLITAVVNLFCITLICMRKVLRQSSALRGRVCACVCVCVLGSVPSFCNLVFFLFYVPYFLSFFLSFRSGPSALATLPPVMRIYEVSSFSTAKGMLFFLFFNFFFGFFSVFFFTASVRAVAVAPESGAHLHPTPAFCISFILSLSLSLSLFDLLA